MPSAQSAQNERGCTWPVPSAAAPPQPSSPARLLSAPRPRAAPATGGIDQSGSIPAWRSIFTAPGPASTTLPTGALFAAAGSPVGAAARSADRSVRTSCRAAGGDHATIHDLGTAKYASANAARGVPHGAASRARRPNVQPGGDATSDGSL